MPTARVLLLAAVILVPLAPSVAARPVQGEFEPRGIVTMEGAFHGTAEPNVVAFESWLTATPDHVRVDGTGVLRVFERTVGEAYSSSPLPSLEGDVPPIDREVGTRTVVGPLKLSPDEGPFSIRIIPTGPAQPLSIAVNGTLEVAPRLHIDPLVTRDDFGSFAPNYAGVNLGLLKPGGVVPMGSEIAVGGSVMVMFIGGMLSGADFQEELGAAGATTLEDPMGSVGTRREAIRWALLEAPQGGATLAVAGDGVVWMLAARLTGTLAGSLKATGVQAEARIENASFDETVGLLAADGSLDLQGDYPASGSRWTMQGDVQSLAIDGKIVFLEEVLLPVGSTIAAVGLLLGLGLYNLAKGKPLANANRLRILKQVTQTPGLTLSQLQGHLGMRRGTFTFHFQVLQASGLVASTGRGRQRHAFLNSGSMRFPTANGTAATSAYAAMSHPIRKALVESAAAGGTSLAEFIRLTGKPRSVVSYHLQALVQEGLLRRIGAGRASRYCPAVDREAVVKHQRRALLKLRKLEPAYALIGTDVTSQERVQESLGRLGWQGRQTKRAIAELEALQFIQVKDGNLVRVGDPA